MLVPIESSCDFLLVINTNLPHILHRFQVTVKFSLARGECFTLTLSLGVIPGNIAVSDISLKTGFFGLHFCCKKYRCVFNYFNFIYPKATEFGEISGRSGYYAVQVIQGHRFWYQSKACMRLPISNLPLILHRFRDIAFEIEVAHWALVVEMTRSSSSVGKKC